MIDMQNKSNLYQYTSVINIPQYTPKGDNPRLMELVDNSRTLELIDSIEKSSCSTQQKEFLKLAAMRHLRFNYKKCAEYYCHADKEMQKLMEDSALVIIDVNDAIAKGYAKLYNRICELRDADG